MTGNKKRYLSDSDSDVGTTGGSGKAGGAGGGDSSFDATSCDIRSQGTLRSPNPSVVGSLQQNDRLDVDVASANDLQVLRATRQGQSAGVIDCPAEREIIRCIGLGNVYAATILRVQGGAVSLLGRRA